ncbi:bifunctional hydroxymethylpyrimidine kinase/phosphomethylpyrimidine kinase [bacterium]|nr:bifunctional hydroxymethylpyrimidine kinase/phosphomethylpyrimidine kinase [bacterium]
MNINKDKLISYINELKNTRVLIIGDLAMDEMVYGNTERISREAPVLILLHEETKLILGAASNAANNASKINSGKVSVIGVLGEDYQAEQLKQVFEKEGINTEYLVYDKTRKTTTKTRISGSCSQSVTQQIVRIDRQTSTPLSKETEDKILEQIEKAVPQHDAIILSDYHIGTLTQKIIDKSIELANKHNKVIVADIQKDFDKYKNITSLTPNLPDTQKFLGFNLNTKEDFEKAGSILNNLIKSKSILVTCGDRGMMVIEPNYKITEIPVFNKSHVFDVTGAGDTVTALYTMALSIGAEPVYAAVIGNIAASIVIKQFGCATTTIEELIDMTLKKEKELCIN